MKKYLLFIFAIASPVIAISQCTPSNITIPGAYPDIVTNLPHAFSGVYYETVIQVRTPLDTTLNGTYAKLTQVTINGIGNLPPGFSYTCTPSNCTLGPLSNGCLQISGTPSQSLTGNYLLDIDITVSGKLYGIIPFSQQTKLSDYKIKILGPPDANFSLDKYNACPGEAVTFSNQSSNDPVTFHWSFPGGKPTSSTLENPVVTYAAPGDYNVTLVATNPAGQGTKTKNAIIHIKAAPSAALVEYVSDTICAGDSTLLEAVQVNNAAYQWYKNGAPVSGAVNYFYYGKSNADYAAEITNTSNGCKALSPSSHVKSIILNASLSASGSETVCYPHKVTLLANQNTALHYTWYKNNAVINSAHASSYTAATSGNYKVKIENSRGCYKTSNTLTVTVNSKPSASINPLGPTTFCAGGSVSLSAVTQSSNAQYQWLRNNLILSGAVTKNYTAVKGGFYNVIVTNRFGCTTKSKKVIITVNCRLADEDWNTNGTFKATVYPNPAMQSSDAIVAVELIQDQQVTIRLSDATGRLADVVSPGLLAAGEHEFHLPTAGLPEGLYFVTIQTETGSSTLKLLVGR